MRTCRNCAFVEEYSSDRGKCAALRITSPQWFTGTKTATVNLDVNRELCFAHRFANANGSNVIKTVDDFKGER